MWSLMWNICETNVKCYSQNGTFEVAITNMTNFIALSEMLWQNVSKCALHTFK